MRTGPCSPWVDGAEVAKAPWVRDAVAKAEGKGTFSAADIEAMCLDSAVVASEVLYELTGRQFTGSCGPVTVRPIQNQPDGRGTAAYYQWDGVTFNYGWGDWGQLYGAWDNPPQIELRDFPINTIDEVKINGTVIPTDEYKLLEGGALVRMLPTANSQPTETYGWPTWQRLDLPDTEDGTFAVTYHYGQIPPAAGVLACNKLAQHIVLPQLGDSTKMPQRVTSVQRQGISSMTVDVMDIVKTGKTGIYEVDLFLRMSNPQQSSRQAAVWSPDMDRSRRY